MLLLPHRCFQRRQRHCPYPRRPRYHLRCPRWSRLPGNLPLRVAARASRGPVQRPWQTPLRWGMLCTGRGRGWKGAAAGRKVDRPRRRHHGMLAAAVVVSAQGRANWRWCCFAQSGHWWLNTTHNSHAAASSHKHQRVHVACELHDCFAFTQRGQVTSTLIHAHHTHPHTHTHTHTPAARRNTNTRTQSQHQLAATMHWPHRGLGQWWSPSLTRPQRKLAPQHSSCGHQGRLQSARGCVHQTATSTMAHAHTRLLPSPYEVFLTAQEPRHQW